MDDDGRYYFLILVYKLSIDVFILYRLTYNNPYEVHSVSMLVKLKNIKEKVNYYVLECGL